MPFPSRDLSLNSLGLVPVNILTRSPTTTVLFLDLLFTLFFFIRSICLLFVQLSCQLKTPAPLWTQMEILFCHDAIIKRNI